MISDKQAIEILNWDDVTGGKTTGRMEKVCRAIRDYCPDPVTMHLEECSDERTGRRYGDAHCRKGRAVKIGGGGRNRGSGYAYQVWLVW